MRYIKLVFEIMFRLGSESELSSGNCGGYGGETFGVEVEVMGKDLCMGGFGEIN